MLSRPFVIVIVEGEPRGIPCGALRVFGPGRRASSAVRRRRRRPRCFQTACCARVLAAWKLGTEPTSPTFSSGLGGGWVAQFTWHRSPLAVSYCHGVPLNSLWQRQQLAISGLFHSFVSSSVASRVQACDDGQALLVLAIVNPRPRSPQGFGRGFRFSGVASFGSAMMVMSPCGWDGTAHPWPTRRAGGGRFSAGVIGAP